MGSRNFKQFLGYDNQPDPKELRENFFKEALKDGTPFPNPLTYEDVDAEFKKWVEEGLQIDFDGKNLPTMTLYSNQRFSEYLQSWSFTDENKNPILNFKTITRENNPNSGTINGETKNIPGEFTWLMKRVAAQDKNGRDYFIEYRMKQPFAVDLKYKVGIFTNKYELINKFNTMVNEKFSSIDAYIRPNGHYVSMTLTDISDDSEYSINDRQYYSQTCSITVRAYIIPEDSFIVYETPKLAFIGFDVEGDGSYADIELSQNIKIADTQTLMNETNDCVDDQPYYYYYRDVSLSVYIDPCDTNLSFTMDTDFTAKTDYLFYTINVKYFKVKINGETVCESTGKDLPHDIMFKNGDLVNICGVVKKKATERSEIVFNGLTMEGPFSDKQESPEDYNEEIIVKE